MVRQERAEKLIFVGGAPRSGTTVTHALLCSAPGVNRFHPEISFFRGLVEAYAAGRAAWTEHTRAFFPDPSDFHKLMRATADTWLGSVWEAVDRPRILCVKDPHLTPYFPALAELLPEAQFVIVFRHPYDVVRSRQEVARKKGEDFGVAPAAAVAHEYRTYYTRILGYNFRGRLFALRYEDLQVAPMREALARFVDVPGFDDAGMWRAAPSGQGVDEANPWSSPKYFRPVDLGRRLEPLAPELRPVVKQVCEPIMTRMHYGEPDTAQANA